MEQRVILEHLNGRISDYEALTVRKEVPLDACTISLKADIRIDYVPKPELTNSSI